MVPQKEVELKLSTKDDAETSGGEDGEAVTRPKRVRDPVQEESEALGQQPDDCQLEEEGAEGVAAFREV